MSDYYLVKFSGPFGFIKPWTAVRDEEIYSQQFLTPSIVEGIEKKLFPELLNERKFQKGKIYKICRHRLAYDQISEQKEKVQTRGWNQSKNGFFRPTSVLTRGILINPVLWLAFLTKKDANKSFSQHICLCRNEDLLFPVELLKSNAKAFDSDESQFCGFELIFGNSAASIAVGYNRYKKNKRMYGQLKTIGDPVKPYYG
jgi:hypothetical protein